MFYEVAKLVCENCKREATFDYGTQSYTCECCGEVVTTEELNAARLISGAEVLAEGMNSCEVEAV